MDMARYRLKGVSTMFKRQLGNHRGVSIVEFALVLPLLLAFLGFTIDFGLAFFVSHMAQNAAREGARLAITVEGLTPGNFADLNVDNRINSLLPPINLFQNFTHTKTFNPSTCQVTVTVNGQSPYFFMPAFLVSMRNPQGSPTSSIAINRSVAMRYEHECTP